MTRCSHDNVTITEMVRDYIDHLFEDGAYKLSDHSVGGEFNTLWVVCKDCGLDRAYSKSYLPKWLAEKWDFIFKRNASIRGVGTAWLRFDDSS